MFHWNAARCIIPLLNILSCLFHIFIISVTILIEIVITDRSCIIRGHVFWHWFLYLPERGLVRLRSCVFEHCLPSRGRLRNWTMWRRCFTQSLSCVPSLNSSYKKPKKESARKQKTWQMFSQIDLKQTLTKPLYLSRNRSKNNPIKLNLVHLGSLTT